LLRAAAVNTRVNKTFLSTLRTVTHRFFTENPFLSEIDGNAIMAGPMEEQLLQLLADTQSVAPGPRKQAEVHLEQLQANESFPTSLVAIASHTSVSPPIRQSALLILKKYVEQHWLQLSDAEGPVVPISDATKEQLRVKLLELSTSAEGDRKITSAARYMQPRYYKNYSCRASVQRMEAC
jgi:hypothetical protein